MESGLWTYVKAVNPPHPNEKKQADSEKGGRAGRGSSTELRLLRGPAFAKPPRGAGRGESPEGAQPALQHAWRLPCTGQLRGAGSDGPPGQLGRDHFRGLTLRLVA